MENHQALFLVIIISLLTDKISAKEKKVLNNDIWEKEKRGEPFYLVVQKEIGIKPQNNYKKYSQKRQDIIKNALNYLGLPYDSGESQQNLSIKDEDGDYLLKDNNTGKVYKIKLPDGKRPLVCTDLVVQALEDAGYKIFLEGFDKRRIKTVLKEYFRKNKNDFYIIKLEFFGYNDIDFFPKVLPGDIIVTMHNKEKSGWTGWHTGIVESVNKNGFPETVINSKGHAGVIVTRALSAGSYTDHNYGKIRYDGFFLEGDMVWIVRIRE
ncbi:hypothetical protein A2331_00740 [Candidatus Falkowbacteria bacterium RIFOXYB2_FULL_34_18]|uniref:Uncharacterized protein n=1 Tax=Candidatus Falkowbacteria bacterium RIFOXYD2_FULL_34_120 TaxID=1798007 RepID=A0A1F5TLZ3_9BACT|nr:MAG: hypothetical protein A2331_00740 [Candidatus Falkowbacteria bacterium RIFOXYB2_FULL_34_18]OGF29216.1 MAG: hypothetical protein A2500_06055 [Candidatus Falkowbacteria bacterium RIFOXYC12_FULL_34_55]OGF37754.1 MAG: hypothetical protein A2466_06385 [Candidatus Falkowbacteria bacterium RIFOXYC2_FULL_34_220]OGF38738.1 MAG: hypothetical protein A2515_01720 [Candidatus Falkowbacteria bacterium RIFOXYD12_FULL_34_57]OGF39972.1 MAG: hypothetical protein A2531_01975 [Candidatus Falkowbacteria bact